MPVAKRHNSYNGRFDFEWSRRKSYEKCRKHTVKIRAFPGTNVLDMYFYITPLLKKNLTYVFVHIGCNDATNMTSQIHDAILCLKCHIEDVLPSCKVYLSAPVLRLDNGKAGITLKHLANKMKNVNNVIFHDNMDRSCLGGGGGGTSEPERVGSISYKLPISDSASLATLQ